MKIRKVEDVGSLYCIQPIYLACILMDNNEIIFNGKSLGFLKEDEVLKFACIKEEEKWIKTKIDRIIREGTEK